MNFMAKLNAIWWQALRVLFAPRPGCIGKACAGFRDCGAGRVAGNRHAEGDRGAEGCASMMLDIGTAGGRRREIQRRMDADRGSRHLGRDYLRLLVAKMM